MNKTIRVGLYDWTEFPSISGFYPDDLPEEWKLSFFANEFSSVCISLCNTFNEALLLEWVEDLPEEFQLSFELNELSQLKALSTLLEQTAMEIDYLIVEPSEQQNWLKNNAYQSVLTRADMIDSSQILSRLSIWTPDNKIESSAIALLPDIDDKRIYRQWIELWLENNGQQELTLWIDGKTARYSTISDLRILVELMGY